MVSIHHTADVHPEAHIGAGTKVWHFSQVQAGAHVGDSCILGRDVFVDSGVRIGNKVKVQNGVSIYRGVTLEDGVMCGPHCTFTNDKAPRAINPDGTLKGGSDWQIAKTLIRYGAGIGAHATIVCGITVGRWAMIGAGAVVTKDVPDYGLVIGCPARLIGYVCACGKRYPELKNGLVCSTCGHAFESGGIQ